LKSNKPSNCCVEVPDQLTGHETLDTPPTSSTPSITISTSFTMNALGILCWIALLLGSANANTNSNNDAPKLKVNHNEISRRYDYKLSFKRPYFQHKNDLEIPYFDTFGSEYTGKWACSGYSDYVVESDHH
jgi:hypothetical protein